MISASLMMSFVCFFSAFFIIVISHGFLKNCQKKEFFLCVCVCVLLIILGVLVIFER